MDLKGAVDEAGSASGNIPSMPAVPLGMCRLIVVLALIVGCGSGSEPLCDARGISINGIYLDMVAYAPDTNDTECLIASAKEYLNPILFSQDTTLAISTRFSSGEEPLYPGNGGGLIQKGDYQCTAYGSSVVDTDNWPSWVIDVDLRCDDGTTMIGRMTGNGDP